MHSEFKQLVEGLCTLTGYTAPQRIIDGGGMTIEDVTFTLMHKPTVDPGALFLHADFGPCDLEEQAALYPLILQENMMLLSTRDCTFSVSPTTECVVLIEKISLADHTPDTLLVLLRSLTRRINYFNKHHRADHIGSRRRFLRNAELRAPR
ncbi:CesT family type III secretion system chaperone [Actimicrobium sp. CCI2.3]|uniref:CesT family type III secretion system chaperone n=1 Tax=Actimicrobium sp. CCI2.3 TaxID=3048616 RepID=UPI002AB4F2A2|nr:CesT family type III secretion system chaperone [Actimicrobium sp. CCI2.3]MDY7575730.1 CesT family type III secretion system chaperone [Actimicrobium sp. CCI2.3]MEB0023769.1 CesT family type III secretion system chaperone [Actimicrobium sp. CCI2.3]